MPRRIRNTQRGVSRPTPEDLERLRLAQILNDIDGAATVPLVQADITDVSATAAEVNLLDLTGLTVGWALLADGPTSASWQALPGMFPGMIIQDEGAPLAGFADTLDFVGDGVTASGAGTTKTVTVLDQQNDSMFLSGLFGTILNLSQTIGPNVQVDLAAALGLSSLQVLYIVAPAVPQITVNNGQPLTFDLTSAGQDVFALRDELDVDIMRVNDTEIAINRAVQIDYDTFQTGEPQFAMTWDPQNVPITTNYIGGALSCSGTFDVSTGVFIPAIFSDTNRYNIGANPGFSAITFINELSVVANDGNFNMPAALVMNIGLSHQRNTAGTSTTGGITGISFSPNTRTFVAGAVMTKTAQTAVRCSPTFGTVAGSTVNLGTITGLDCFAPAAGLFQPGAGVENMTAYYGINFPNMTFGGAGRVISVVRSLLNAATNVYFLDHTGTAPSRLGGDLDITGDIIISGTVDGRDVALDGTNQDNHIADATIHFTEASIDHLNIASIGVNSHAAIDTHIADATIHFTEASIDHTAIANIGTNSHAAIDTHIADANIHYADAPNDGNDYVRNSLAWSLTPPGFNGLGIWRYRTETSAPPGSGQIRFDNADVSLSTEFYLHETNDTGDDVAAFLDALVAEGSVLYIQDRTDSTKYILIETGTFVDNGAYRTYQIDNLIEGSGGEPSNNTRVAIVAVSPAGGGAGGSLPAGTVTDAVLRWDGAAWVEETQARITSGGLFHAANGSAGGVAFGNVGDINTGMYFTGNDIVRFAAGAVNSVIIQNDRLLMNTAGGAEMMFESMTATNPGFTRLGDEDTGLSIHSGNMASLVAGGVEALRAEALQLTMGNYVFDTDQAVGAGQDNFVLTYDDASGQILLEAAAGGGNPFATPLGILGDADGAPPLSLNARLNFWDSDQSDIMGSIGYGGEHLELENFNHGGKILITAEDAAGTVRSILDADPDSVTIMRADTNIQLEHAAGTQRTIHGNASTDIVTLYHNNVAVTNTQAVADGGFRVDNQYSSDGFERVQTDGDFTRKLAPIWEFNTGVGPGNPGNGHFTFDSATLGSITQMRVDDQDIYANADQGTTIAKITTGDYLYFREEASDVVLIMEVTGAATDQTGFWHIPVSYVSGTLGPNSTRFSVQVLWYSLAGGGGVTDHTLLTNIGVNTHAQIDTHIADGTIHFTEASLNLATTYLALDCSNDPLTAPLELTANLIDLNNSGAATAVSIMGRNSAGGINMNVNTTTGHGQLGQISGAGAAEDVWIHMTRDGQVELRHNNTAMARTALIGSGGFEVNNTVTGAGFERVLTTSDLGGGSIGGSITDNQVAVGAAVANDIEGTANFLFEDAQGRLTIIETGAGTDQLQIQANATNCNFLSNVNPFSYFPEGVGTSRFGITQNYSHTASGASFRFYGPNNLDYVEFIHDNTDLDIIGVSTVDINITGITSIQAGTVDADFDNLTATDFNGVPLTTAGVATNYLDETGNYSVPAGGGFTPPIDLADNEQIRFGTGQDFLMDFDGTNMHFEHVGATFATIWETAGGGIAVDFRDGNTTGTGSAVGISFSDQIGGVYGQILTSIITSTFIISGTNGLVMTSAMTTQLSSDVLCRVTGNGSVDGILRVYDNSVTDYIEITHDGNNGLISNNAGLLLFDSDFNMQDNSIRNVGLDNYFLEDLDITVAANALTVSCNISNSFEADLEAATGAVTATLSDPGNAATGNYYQCVIKVEQDSTTPQTVTWAGGTMRWPDGVAHPMNTTAGGFSIFTFETWDDGDIWYGTGRDYS